MKDGAAPRGYHRVLVIVHRREMQVISVNAPARRGGRAPVAGELVIRRLSNLIAAWRTGRQRSKLGRKGLCAGSPVA